jgi:hypothetical protein
MAAMSPRLQIVVSSRPGQQPGMAPRASFWKRFKLLIAGIAIAVVAVAVLIVALVLGSILATVLSIALVSVILILILRATFQRSRS